MKAVVFVEKEYQTMTEAEFKAKGIELFGDDQFKWKFQCPICDNIQTAEDFRQYKDKGSIPGSAYQECIGRYQDDPYRAFGPNKKDHKTSPCDYTVGGLFKIGNTIKLENRISICVFPFANSRFQYIKKR